MDRGQCDGFTACDVAGAAVDCAVREEIKDRLNEDNSRSLAARRAGEYHTTLAAFCDAGVCASAQFGSARCHVI